MHYSKRGDGMGKFYLIALAVTLLVMWIWSMGNDGREAACIRNGYTPVYVGRMGSVEYCERVTNGRSEVIDPDNLP